MFEGKLPYNVKTVTFFSKMFWRTAEIKRKNSDLYVAFVADTVFIFCFFCLLFCFTLFFFIFLLVRFDMVL